MYLRFGHVMIRKVAIGILGTIFEYLDDRLGVSKVVEGSSFLLCFWFICILNDIGKRSCYGIIIVPFSTSRIMIENFYRQSNQVIVQSMQGMLRDGTGRQEGCQVENPHKQRRGQNPQQHAMAATTAFQQQAPFFRLLLQQVSPTGLTSMRSMTRMRLLMS